MESAAKSPSQIQTTSNRGTSTGIASSPGEADAESSFEPHSQGAIVAFTDPFEAAQIGDLATIIAYSLQKHDFSSRDDKGILKRSMARVNGGVRGQ